MSLTLVLIGLFVIWGSKNWSEAGSHIKLSENYIKLEKINPSGPSSNNQNLILRIQGWDQKTYKPCSIFFKKTHVSNFITRDFIKSRSHLERAFISCRLERDYTHHQLRTYFLANAYVGKGQYGVEALSKDLFAKPFENLTKRELIRIGLIMQTPTLRNDNDTIKTKIEYWLEKTAADS